MFPVSAVIPVVLAPRNESPISPNISFHTSTASSEAVRSKFCVLDFLVGLVTGLTIEQNEGGFVKDRFYGGSRLLKPITDWCGIPVDMVNFVVASFVSIFFGLFMRYCLSPARVRPAFRAIAEIVIGAAVVIFCYGMQFRVLVLQSVVVYAILFFGRRDKFYTAVMVTVWSLLYLMLIHLCRLYYDYEGYTLDISGALMLQTQRLSSLAFNLYDGARIAKAESPNGVCKKDSASSTSAEDADDSTPIVEDRGPKIMATSRECAVAKMPDPLEFSAYCIYFHGVCIGPFVFFKDYRNYLHGYRDKKLPPINVRRFFHLTLRVSIYGGIYATFFKHVPIGFIRAPPFRRLSILGQTSYMCTAFFIARLKYYFGWCLAEMLGMCAGNGFTGVSAKFGETEWLNVHNFDFFQVEIAPNLKLLIDAWNIGTVKWLREVVYFRTPPKFRTIVVFVVSAFWHGLYPGYYLMFLTFALFTHAARAWRRSVRPLVVAKDSKVLSCMYDIFTVVLTHFLMEYAQAPFHLLSLMPSLELWTRFLFMPHIISLGVILLTAPIVKALRAPRVTHLSPTPPPVSPTGSIQQQHNGDPVTSMTPLTREC